MSTRELILQRINEIEKEAGHDGKFNPRIMRWQSAHLRGIPLNQIESFTLLPDDELVEVFEIILRQYYKQM